MRPCGIYDETYSQDMAIFRTKAHWGIFIVAMLLLYTLPFYASNPFLSMANFIGISIISAQGLSILTGYTGQVSLGQGASMAVGAYTSAILVIRLGLPFWVSLPLAGISSGIVGVILGLPSLRIKGFYLTIATLAAQFVIPWLINHVRVDITGGVFSLVVPPPKFGDFVFRTQTSMFYLIITVVIIMIYFAKNILRTGMGRAFVAIRDNDLAAEVMGINLYYYKLVAFFVCTFYAGIAGALWAHWMRAINTEHFGLMESVWYLGMIIVGGMGSTAGAVMGTIFIRFLEEMAKVIAPHLGGILPGIGVGAELALNPIFFGLVIMVFVIFEPRGLAHRWEMFKAYYRLWPFSY